MKITRINFKKDLESIKDIWNKEYELIYPISQALIERNTINAYTEASFIAKENEEIAGFIISKNYDDDYLETYKRKAEQCYKNLNIKFPWDEQ